MQLRFEDKSAIPEDSADNFVEFKEGDKTVFLHKDLAEAKKEAFRFKGDLTRAQEEQESMAERLERLEQERQERERQDEARKHEELKKSGKTKEIEEAWKSKLEQTENQWKEKYESLQGEYLGSKKQALISDLAQAGTDDTRKDLSRLIAQDIKLNEKGEFVVLDESGKQTADTIEEYKASIAKRYPALVRGSQSSGGNGKGASAGGGEPAKTMSRKDFEALPQDKRHEAIKNGIKLVDD